MPAAELTYNTGASAVQMANEIFGAGTTVVGASYSGSGYSSAIFSDGDSISPGATPADSGVILSTGRATNYTNSSGEENVRTNTSTNSAGANNDAQFNAIAGASTFDASILTVDFIPTTDTFSMQFIYSSEEYPEFVNSIYNDIVGVWINGDYVELAVGDGDSNVGNIHAGNNENLFRDNTGDTFNTEMDGFTVTLTLTLNVIPNTTNTLRIGIADVGDSSYDSNLLIAGDSIQNVVLASDDEFDVIQNGTPTLDVLGNDTEASGGVLTITHVNGLEVTAGDVITLSTGQQLTLNADGTFDLVNGTDLDSYNFSYTTENGAGISDSAFVTINTLPCFVAGTMILTPDGERPVESLRPGDHVTTYDSGTQPIRWIGQRDVIGEGSMAPIKIAANTFGIHRPLKVSPQHRVLLRDQVAELLFGQQEVLVAAKDLVNDHSVRRDISNKTVRYVHILFDKHEVIYSEGLETESFLPGPQTLSGFAPDTVDEICAIFPELDPETGLGYGTAARTSLKAYEAQLLLGGVYAA